MRRLHRVAWEMVVPRRGIVDHKGLCGGSGMQRATIQGGEQMVGRSKDSEEEVQ